MGPHIIVLDEPTNHLDIESVEALTDAVRDFNGGLVVVTHDARLIQAIDCELWVVEDGGVYRFEKDFDGYRDKVLNQLEERQAAVERNEQKRREERAKQREKLAAKKKENEKDAKNVTTNGKDDATVNNGKNQKPETAANSQKDEKPLQKTAKK